MCQVGANSWEKLTTCIPYVAFVPQELNPHARFKHLKSQLSRPNFIETWRVPLCAQPFHYMEEGCKCSKRPLDHDASDKCSNKAQVQFILDSESQGGRDLAANAIQSFPPPQHESGAVHHEPAAS